MFGFLHVRFFLLTFFSKHAFFNETNLAKPAEIVDLVQRVAELEKTKKLLRSKGKPK